MTPAPVSKQGLPTKTTPTSVWLGRHLRSLVSGPPDARRNTLRTFGRLFAGFTLFGVTLAVMFALTESAAIGFSAARLLYSREWLSCVGYSIAAPLVLLACGLGIELSSRAVTWPGWLILRFAGPKRGRQINTVLAALILVGFSVSFVAAFVQGLLGEKYMNAKHANQLPGAAEKDAAPKIRAVVNAQASANKKISEDAEVLLHDLDQTQQGLVDAKTKLRFTLEQLATQRAAIAKTSSDVDALIQQGELVRLKNDQLRAVLDGQEPVTRGYFDRSGWQTLAIGVLLGWLGAPAWRAVTKIVRRLRASAPAPIPATKEVQLSLFGGTTSPIGETVAAEVTAGTSEPVILNQKVLEAAEPPPPKLVRFVHGQLHVEVGKAGPDDASESVQVAQHGQAILVRIFVASDAAV